MDSVRQDKLCHWCPLPRPFLLLNIYLSAFSPYALRVFNFMPFPELVLVLEAGGHYHFLPSTSSYNWATHKWMCQTLYRHETQPIAFKGR